MYHNLNYASLFKTHYIHSCHNYKLMRLMRVTNTFRFEYLFTHFIVPLILSPLHTILDCWMAMGWDGLE